MAAIPNFQLGRNWATCTIQALTVAANGTITTASASSILTQIKSCRNTYKNTLQEVSATTSRRENNVVESSANTVELVGWLIANDSVATPTNLLTNYVNLGYDYFGYILKYAGVTYTGMGILESYEDGVQNKGGQEFTMSLNYIDPGTTNPAVT